HFEAFCLNVRLGLQYQHGLCEHWALTPAIQGAVRVFTEQLTPRVSTNINEDFGDRLSGTLRLDLSYFPAGEALGSSLRFGVGVTCAKNALAVQANLAWQFY
ncbi:MAG TPA: hypothetical protein VL860_14015, partial [Planctomycetota bacterium]|nr:hypothetical protein [Planctomycetota bacterium]